MTTSKSCKKKICPLKKEQDSAFCSESCSWYNPVYQCCSFFLLADSVTDLRDILWNWFKKFVEPLEPPMTS